MPVLQYFPYFGPNRRSDKRVIEIKLEYGPGDGPCSSGRIKEIKDLLITGSVLSEGEYFPEQSLPDEPVAWYASLLTQIALLFQRKAGHRVDLFFVSCNSGQKQCYAVLEYEHCDVGMTAVKLAEELVSGKRNLLAEPFALFCKFARQRLLPLETEAIIKAAKQRDIPCSQLERQPFSRDKNQSFCVRPNGLLLLGHGARKHILDGTFCLDKSGDRLKALFRNRLQRRAILEELGVPIANTSGGIANTEDIIRVFFVDGRVTAAVALSGGQIREVVNLHASLIDLGIAINHEVDGFPVVVSLSTADATKPLAQSGGRVEDFELGPDLEQLAGLQPGSRLLEKTVIALLEWLFPGGDGARIPIVAVTGTNGKTTTSRMISHVMMTSGRKPGTVCTDGIFLNGKQISNTDASSLLGHTNVLTSKHVDVAVLESHHRGIFVRGFAFDWCDVAVCLNVTDDHLDEMNIRSVEEMAIVKRALIERARYAAVLNADDKLCLNMLAYVVAEKTCLVSMQSAMDDLRIHANRDQLCFCVLERVEGVEWVVIYDQIRVPVMPVNAIPATFDGLARFNVSNAMHAIAASYLAGVESGDIKTGMEEFVMSFENTPGRLNFYDEHPFRVLMDYAHNTDGTRQLCEFVERLEVSGRKLLMLQARGDIEDKYVDGIAAAAARYFDHFVCRTHPLYPGPDIHKGPEVLRTALLASGVHEDQVTVTTDPAFAVDMMLKMGSVGDLLVFTPGSGQPRIDNWNQVISFDSGTTGRE